MVQATNTALLQALLSRRSTKPKYLTEPAPHQEAFQIAARAALRAPDHGGLTPYRFVQIEASQREKLAQLFEAAARKTTTDEEHIARIRSKALKGPAIVGFVYAPQLSTGISSSDQLLAAGAALNQFILALKALGFGAIVLSGHVLEDQDLQKAFAHGPDDKLLAWITCGTIKDGETMDEEETRNGPLEKWA